jgi:hypothetical protein
MKPQAAASPYSAAIFPRTSIPEVANETSPTKFPEDGIIQRTPEN